MRRESSLREDQLEVIRQKVQKLSSSSHPQEFKVTFESLKYRTLCLADWGWAHLVFDRFSEFAKEVWVETDSAFQKNLFKILNLIVDALEQSAIPSQPVQQMIHRFMELLEKKQKTLEKPKEIPEEVKKFIFEFLEDASRSFFKLRFETDPHRLSRLIHSIKGNARIFLLQEIESQCEKLESQIKSGVSYRELQGTILRILDERARSLEAYRVQSESKRVIKKLNVRVGVSEFEVGLDEIYTVQLNPQILYSSEIQGMGYWKTSYGLYPVYSSSPNSKIGILLKTNMALMVDAIAEIVA